MHEWRLLIYFLILCRYNLKKLTYEERKAKLVSRLAALNAAVDDEDEDDDEWKTLCFQPKWWISRTFYEFPIR